MSEREPAEATAVPGDGQPPFRYDARLAGEIEARWQARWAADGTFNSPNPAGGSCGPTRRSLSTPRA